jgi:hypothetical protein
LDEESLAVAFLVRVYRDFKQTMMKVDRWLAFTTIGFTHDIDQIPYELLFDAKKSRRSEFLATQDAIRESVEVTARIEVWMN